jgi:hypothetical protein
MDLDAWTETVYEATAAMQAAAQAMRPLLEQFTEAGKYLLAVANRQYELGELQRADRLEWEAAQIRERHRFLAEQRKRSKPR